MSLLDWISVFLCLAGGFFYLAGTVGMLRFPDTFCRLHALTKADNLGLGFLVLAMALQADRVSVVLKLVLIWLLTLLAGTSACFVIGRYILARQTPEEEE